MTIKVLSLCLSRPQRRRELCARPFVQTVSLPCKSFPQDHSFHCDVRDGAPPSSWAHMLCTVRSIVEQHQPWSRAAIDLLGKHSRAVILLWWQGREQSIVELKASQSIQRRLGTTVWDLLGLL